MQRSAKLLFLALGAIALLSGPASAQDSTNDANEPSAAARQSAAEGMKLFKDGKYEEAAANLKKALAEFQAPQYRLYIGRSYSKLGRLVEACDQYEAAAQMQSPSQASEDSIKKFDKAKKLAEEDLAELRGRIPAVAVSVSGPEISLVRVTEAGGPVRVSIEGDTLRVEMNPGDRTLRLEAADFDSVELRVKATERTAGAPLDRMTVTLARTEAPRPKMPVATTPEAAVKPPVGTGRVGPAVGQLQGSTPDADKGSLSNSLFSRRKQPGAYVRGDFEVIHGGAVAAVGFSYGVHDFIELHVGALLGRDVAVEPGVTVYFLRGQLKPRVDVAVPIFFEEDPYVGVRGSGGIQWDPWRHFGVFLQAGVAYFPVVPNGYDNVVFVPSLGIQGRL